MQNNLKLVVTGKGFTEVFENTEKSGNIISLTYKTSILMSESIDLDTLDIEIQSTVNDFSKYMNSLGSISAVLYLGGYKTSFFHVPEINPISFSTSQITYHSFRMTTFPKKTAKVFDKDFNIYQEKSLFKLFARIMKDNSIPASAYEFSGSDTELPLNEIKEEGISQIEFLRRLCFNYGYGIVNRDNKIKLIDLDLYSKKAPDFTIDFNDVSTMTGLSEEKAKLNAQYQIAFVQVTRNDPNKGYFKTAIYQSDAILRDIYNANAEYISVNGLIPLTTLHKKLNSLFREAQQKTLTFSLIYSNYVPIFAGMVVRIKNYMPTFNVDYLVQSTTYSLSGDKLQMTVSLVQKYNKKDFNITFEQYQDQ